MVTHPHAKVNGFRPGGGAARTGQTGGGGMDLFLGVDGGGTGCRAAVCDAAGRVLGRGEAGPANISVDVMGASENIRQAIGGAMAQADVPGSLAGAVLGLAGANVAGAADRVAALLPYAGLRIVSDAVIAARGALGPGDGLLALIGTGSVFARQQGGQVRLFGGRGFLLGDEGSGAVLGRRLLAEALRADDGFRPMTPLLAAVLAQYGGADRLLAHALTAPPAAFARHAPDLWHSDDPAAAAIVAAETASVAACLDALQPRGGPALPVVFAGGLGPAYAARLAGRWPMAAPQGAALDGALAMAREGRA